jgi:hypothetical protein
MTAWEQRAADQVPSQQELGKAVAPTVRSSWVQALGAAPSGNGSEALLRLAIAAEAPTPADHLNARRALQLQLLTRRNDPTPAQTWGRTRRVCWRALMKPAQPGACRAYSRRCCAVRLRPEKTVQQGESAGNSASNR